jgi:hypothetical protein
MGDMNDWPTSFAEDRTIKTYALILKDGVVRAERNPFGAFTYEDLERMGLADKLFGD